MKYETRTCSTCLVRFEPSSRHASCPRCRSKNRKRNPCESCGRPATLGAKVCQQCRPVSRERNGNWKGGRIKHSKGYVYLRTSVDGIPKYVFEHVLVMENSLGRKLLPGENVHHKNGVKDDNRIQNLELWIKPQPNGVRAIDALAWAREIISLYGEIENKI